MNKQEMKQILTRERQQVDGLIHDYDEFAEQSEESIEDFEETVMMLDKLSGLSAGVVVDTEDLLYLKKVYLDYLENEREEKRKIEEELNRLYRASGCLRRMLQAL
jgi:RNA polymerase-binding transcription factor DksA